MAQARDEVKLELFRREIMERASAEKDQIVQNTEAEKRARLYEAENNELDVLYQRMQTETASIRTEKTRELSHELAGLKKDAYMRREQYLTQLVAEARAELVVFTRSEEYPGYLLRQAARLAKNHDLSSCVLCIRAEDEQYASMLREQHPGCTVETSDRVHLGGILLRCPRLGVEEDCSLDAALEEEKARIHTMAALKLE